MSLAALLEVPTLDAPTPEALMPAPHQPAPAPHTAALTLPGTDRVVLTGFMGSGKTVVGAALAARLGWAFVDLDREIERRQALAGTPRSVPQIFADGGEKGGEAYFRHLETAALAALLGQRNIVLALGGGAPELLGNRLLLEQTPRTAVVYLAAPLKTLLDRCQADERRVYDTTAPAVHRPLLAEAETRFLTRHPLYTRIARHTVHTQTLAIEETANAILTALQTPTP